MKLLSLTFDNFAEEFERQFGKKKPLAVKIYRDFYEPGKPSLLDYASLRDCPELVSLIEHDYRSGMGRVVSSYQEEDVIKLTTRYADGLEAESVIVPMANRTTLCISSQVGCRMGCVFCETGSMGFARNLTVSEIVAQVYRVKVQMGIPVQNVVFMGMGEPFDNLENVVQAIKVMEDQRGLDIVMRRITISTAGLVPGIKLLADMNLPRINLAVSLNAPSEEIRNKLMPINRKYSMKALKTALFSYPLPKKGALFIEYIQIRGVNDRPGDARLISEFLNPLNVKLNLIPYNPKRNSPYKAPLESDVERFQKDLIREKIFVRRRSTKGRDIMAACGQLGKPGKL